jgi:TetR/AcrR family transcriptional repressor of nem operon
MSSSDRETLLTEGLRVIYERGYGSTSIRHIVEAAGLTRAAFDAHFSSKEDFGMQILDIYFANSCAAIALTLRNDDAPPLQRLHHYLELNRAHLERDGMRNGCLYGNFSAEGSQHSELLRSRLVDIFTHVQQSLAYCLRAAADAGQLRPRLECDEVAQFAVAALQGAILLAKSERSPAPVVRFEKMLFSMIEQQ